MSQPGDGRDSFSLSKGDKYKPGKKIQAISVGSSCKALWKANSFMTPQGLAPISFDQNVTGNLHIFKLISIFNENGSMEGHGNFAL